MTVTSTMTIKVTNNYGHKLDIVNYHLDPVTNFVVGPTAFEGKSSQEFSFSSPLLNTWGEFELRMANSADPGTYKFSASTDAVMVRTTQSAPFAGSIRVVQTIHNGLDGRAEFVIG
ncbi:hypothetical protein [Streptomyces sp. 900105245]